MAHNMVPSSCSSVDATCCRASCCTVNVQLGEIKDELKGLRNMVDITVRLLSKLVPDSIDDFKNILNGRTGLTITRVPTVAPGEDDNVETKVMVVEEHNTANKDSLSRCNSEPGDIEVIDPFPAASVEHASRSTSPGSTYDLRRESGSSSSGSSSLSAFPKEDRGANYTDVVKNCEKTPVPVIGTPLESLNTLTSQLRSPPLSISVAPISENVPKDYCKNLVPDLQEKSSSLNISQKEESDTLISRGEIYNAFPSQLASDSYQLNRLEETSRALPILSVNSISALLEDQTIRLPPDTDVIQEGVAVKEELSSENDFSALSVPSPDNQDIDAKDELQGYLGDGVLPVCVVMKREEEDCPIINQEFTSSCEASNQNCAAMNYNGRSADEGMLYGAREGSNYFADASVNQLQVDSPLKTLFGISLVSKLKQKIQEKIQAAVSTAIEDSTPVAESENDRSNLVDPGSSLNISVNLNSENNSTNSNQPTVSNNKAHPKFYQCRSCAKVFFCTIALNTHKSNCIGSQKHFRCSSCPLMFKSKAVLCNHRRIHARSKRHKCDKCGKQFTLKSSLKRHKQMHACIVASNNRYKKLPQHLCNVCGQGFLNATNLSLHQTLHVVDRIIPKTNPIQDTTDKKQAAINAIKNVRRYPCGYCEEAFIDKRSVTLHEKLHTDKEFAPFEQERKRIQRRYQLMLKMQKEQQEKEKKQFGCTVCGRCYPQELLLHMHTRLHHAIS